MATSKRTGAATEPSKTETAAPRQDNSIEVLVNGASVEVPPAVKAAVQRAIEGSRQPLPKEMTTTQAAEFLDVSRPFIIKLIKRGELPCRMVGKRRRIPSDALLEQREKIYQRGKIVLDELAQLSQELGLYELDGPPPETE